MTENLAYTPESLYHEAERRGREQGVASREEWNDLVEEVIEEHRAVGEMHDDEELEDLERMLRERFDEYIAGA